MMYYVLQYRLVSDSFENDWILVSNALKPQRRFTLTGLLPTTLYQLRMEAHNVAGSATADFNFITLTKDGGKFASKSNYHAVIKSNGLFVAHFRCTTAGANTSHQPCNRFLWQHEFPNCFNHHIVDWFHISPHIANSLLQKS